MSVDYKYEKYAELYPRQYEFIMSCNFGQAREAVNDPDCPGGQKSSLKSGLSLHLRFRKRMMTRRRQKR